MISTNEILIIISIIILTLFVLHIRRRWNHPPGPLGFPIFGMLPYQLVEMFLTKPSNEISDAEKHREFKEKYGPIWSIEFGKQRVITLSSWTLINEAFVENAELFSGRPTNPAYKMVSHGKGILLTDGEMWRESRQLAIKSLRELGMGKKTLEETISNEAYDLVSFLKNLGQGPVNIMNPITKAVTNVILNLVFAEKDRYDNTELEKYVDNLRVLAHSDSAGRKAGLAPALFKTKLMRWLYPEAIDFINASQFCYEFIREKCVNKMKSFESDHTPDCVLDFFMRYRFAVTSALSKDEQKQEIIHSIYDLFNAGVDTTSNLLSFCCLMLGKHGNLQTELRNEITDAIGESGTINLETRKSCPKILSFIDEVHRFCCIVPKVHHRVMKNCEFHGFKFHTDDIIFGDFTNIFTDPNLFDNPLQFDANRFLDETKTKYIPNKYLIPFGIGKRACLGESIAVMESFIFLVSIIRRFHITLPEKTSQSLEKILKGHSGIVHAPLQHLLTIDII